MRSSRSHVRDGHRETPKEIMYRGRMSLDGIAKMYSENDYQALHQDMVRAKRFDTGSCSESCEIFEGSLISTSGGKLHDAMLSVR